MSSEKVLTSVNPHDGTTIEEYRQHTSTEVEGYLAQTAAVQPRWARRSISERAKILHRAADGLRERSDELAELMASEMGKPLAGGRSEVEKCAWACEYYADNAAGMLADVERPSAHSAAWTVYRPLGTVLAVMPWNFPLWQVFRFAAPTLMAGNAGMLKHASNVSGCALAIQEIFAEAGLDEGVFRTLLMSSDRIEGLVADRRIAAVTLTGSEPAGRAVARAAGQNLKPSVLELGGSDPYVVLSDADVEETAQICATSRLLNSGQSCIAAKRFIVVADVYDQFMDHFVGAMQSATVGDPLAEGTDVGPQARRDLRDDLHDQVKRSLAGGAELVIGGIVPDGEGAYYPVTVLDNVRPGMAAFDTELFGPVAAVTRARDEEEAIELANTTEFGLGGAVFTADTARGRRLAADRVNTGNCFVNAMVASDPRLPFGGIGISGYGRELSEMGIRAFVNAKTVAVA